MERIKQVYSDDLEEVVSLDKYIIYKIINETGEGTITNYKLFPGIELCYNDMHVAYCRESEKENRNIIEVNHCIEGRFECELSNGKFVYIGPGDMAINHWKNRPIKSTFPISHYHGISVILDVKKMEEGMKAIEKELDMNLSFIVSKFCKSPNTFIMRATPSIEHIFNELYNVPESIKFSYLKLKVLELLLFLENAELKVCKNKSNYYPRKIVEKVKAIHSFLIDNLQERYTISFLSEEFRITSTVLKESFKGVYGQPIYEYMKCYRVKKSALMLRNTDKSISSIAEEMGYCNRSKFSTAFKSIMNMTPLQYRKNR